MKSVMKDVLVSTLRNKDISPSAFRWTADKLMHVLANQAAEHLQTKTISFETPISPTEGISFSKNVVLVPILRSGITMLPPFLQYFPDARIGIVGLKRDEQTKQANWYYKNVPPISSEDQVMILDPMLATGGTTVETITFLTEKGVTQKQIIFVGIVSAPEGEQAVKEKFPNVTLLIAAQDVKLNDQAFIVPGLGDFGDRYFGTE